MNSTVPVFVASLLLLPIYMSVQTFATHTNIFIPVLEIEPENLVVGESAKITFVLTNKGNTDMSDIQLSFSLDGEWIIDDIRVNAPAHQSIRASFEGVLPVEPGQHQLKACPDRKSLGDDGHQCQTIDFVATAESGVIVTIISPREEETLHGSTTIKVAALGREVDKVELYVHNQLAGTLYQAPFDFTLDTSRYEDGKYNMYAIAYYESGTSKPSAVKKYFINNSESIIVKVVPTGLEDVETRVGQRVVIESDVTNYQTFRIAATFILLVKDSNGFTEFISWAEERIPVNGTLAMSQSWIPDRDGTYGVEVFLWDTIENPVPLSDVMKANVRVK